ncbi:hypothetical protein ACFX13_029071 [Malus domestica]
MNCDGAWRNEKGCFGWVARNFAGIFRATAGIGNYPCASCFIAEANAVRTALVASMGNAHLVTYFVFKEGDFHSWNKFEPERLFNTLTSDVNISIRI